MYTASAGQENAYIQQRPLYSTRIPCDRQSEPSNTYPPVDPGRSHIPMHGELSQQASSLLYAPFPERFSEEGLSHAEDLMSPPFTSSSLGPQAFGPNMNHDLEIGPPTFDYGANLQDTQDHDQLHHIPMQAYVCHFDMSVDPYGWSSGPSSFIPDIVDGQGFFDPFPYMGPPGQTGAQAYHQATNNSRNLMMDDRSFLPPNQY